METDTKLNEIICPKCLSKDHVSKVEWERTKHIHHLCCKCKIVIEEYKDETKTDME